jgi:hypothetical protein
MPETVNLLEQAAELEAKKFLQLVSSLENDQLYMFINAVAELKPDESARTVVDIIHIAKNVKNIGEALEDFYVA